MKALVSYFVNYPKLNYVLLAFIFVVGVMSYKLIPKEVFPDASSNVISIQGSYAGASPQSLNSFAVTPIENAIKSLEGIDELISTIAPNTFSVQVVLQDHINPNEIIDEIKDGVALAKRNFPSDMNDPTVTIAKRERPLMNVTLSSDTLTNEQMMQTGEDLQTLLLGQSDVSNVYIYGHSDLQVDIYIDDKKARALGVDGAQVAKAISQLSYIFPLGTIEQVGGHIYLSTQNSKVDYTTWSQTLLTVSGKKLYLGDIATITVGYPLQDTIARYNLKESVKLSVYQGDTGNAIEIAQGIKERLQTFEKAHPSITLDISSDRSKRIKDRLDTVIANIMFGLILVGVLIYFLISPRLSAVILIGVPFSFIITIIMLYYMGQTINMISLMALLITIGIVVDDAIIVSENIQRHIDNGSSVNKAVIDGTMQVLPPVLIASATTIFAFMPLLMLSGPFGSIMMLVPIVVTVAIIASVVEALIFLPLHAKHILRPKEKLFSWEGIYTAHSKILHYFIYYKKTFLALFVIIVPIVTVWMLKNSSFQFFPRLDSDDLKISVELDKSMTLEQSNKVSKLFEERLMQEKKALYIKSVSATVGLYRTIDGSRETIENAFYIDVDLEDFDEDNFIQNYLNPIFALNFDFAQKDKIRKEKGDKIIKKIRAIIRPMLKEVGAINSNIEGQRMGVIKTDLAIDLSGKDTQAIVKGLHAIKDKLATIDGVVDISDNAKLGKDEYKMRINDYGQRLGVTDELLASTVANFFLERTQAYTLHPDGVVDIKTHLLDKNSVQALEDLRIQVGEQFVKLKDVVDINIVRNFAKIEKQDTITSKTVYANVVPEKITANDAIKELQVLFESLRDERIDVSLRGEHEQTQKLADELSRAFVVAMFLIFIVLLINFNSFKIVFMIISVIPFTILGVLVGHAVMGMNLTALSFIGMLGLAGVVINDGIVLLDFLKYAKNLEEFYTKVKQRVRPILITSITTMAGLSTLIFYPSGQGVFLQPLAVSLGFGLLWGTIINLFYLPALFALLFKLKKES